MREAMAVLMKKVQMMSTQRSGPSSLSKSGSVNDSLETDEDVELYTEPSRTYDKFFTECKHPDGADGDAEDKGTSR